MDYDLDDGEMRGELPPDNGPTFEDLAIDDSLSDVDRVTKYVCSNIALQRVMHVKMLYDTALAIGFDATCERLLPLLEPLVADVEYVVRQHVAFQFPLLCAFVVDAGGSTGYRVLLDCLVPLVARLVADDQHDVRAAASDSLVELAALVHSEDQGQHILTIVLPLAHDDDNEQFRISAIALYNGLAQFFGEELCQQFCVPELISLSEDPVFRVRKSTAQSFSTICRVAGPALSRERLVPAFCKLASDDIWGVRKACAESLVSMANALALEDRGPLLRPLFDRFVSDTSRWVRMAAFQNLGPFIAALATPDVTDDLVSHYVSMATTVSQQLGGSGEADIKFHCAYSLPAVVSVVGAAAWPMVLQPVFDRLYRDSFWKVRRTLAFSLHELARLLGQQVAETQLATAFDCYLRDDNPDVQLGAVTHFADFLTHVSPAVRANYLAVLSDFVMSTTTTKWRVRAVVSQQLAQLCELFTHDATFAVIYPLVLKLVADPVAVVRQSSYHACPLLVARLQSNSAWLADVVAQFVALATSRHFSDRQTFVRICEAFVAADDASDALDRRAFFCASLAAPLFALATDPVSNVRVVFAELVLKQQDYLSSVSACPEALAQLLRPTRFATPEELLAALPTPQSTRSAVAETPTAESAESAETAETAIAAVETVESTESTAVTTALAALDLSAADASTESLVASADDIAHVAAEPVSASDVTVHVSPDGPVPDANESDATIDQQQQQPQLQSVVTVSSEDLTA